MCKDWWFSEWVQSNVCNIFLLESPNERDKLEKLSYKNMGCLNEHMLKLLSEQVQRSFLPPNQCHLRLKTKLHSANEKKELRKNSQKNEDGTKKSRKRKQNIEEWWLDMRPWYGNQCEKIALQWIPSVDSEFVRFIPCIYSLMDVSIWICLVDTFGRHIAMFCPNAQQ